MISAKSYDVIVVGAGPAGSAAAKAAAEGGAKTLLIEEHTQIGIPQHCSGLLYGTISGVGEDVLATLDKRVILSEVKVRRVFSPKGRMMEIPLEGKGIWLLDRSLFDLQIAGQAADAGAEILINTKVTGLLTAEQRIVGVTTNAKALPEISAKIVIAADGIKAPLGGIPRMSGLVDKTKGIFSGVTLILGNVKDIDLCVQELHIGRYGGEVGWVWLERCDTFTCLADFENLKLFEECRKGDSILSKKIRDAVPMRMTGWALPKFGKPLDQKVKSGLILTGAAAKYYTFISCLVSGRYAGQTAAAAVLEGDVSAERLSIYNSLCESLIEPIPEISVAHFANRTEAEQEALFEKMLVMDDVNFDVQSI